MNRRDLADRSATGTRLLLRALGTWLRAGHLAGRERAKAVAGRAGAALALGWFTGGVLYAAPVMMWPAAAVWLTAAWWAGRKAARQAEHEAAFVQLLADLIGDRNGVLLADVAAVLRERDPRTEIGHVRAQCEALDIPVRDKIKVGGSVSVGVHTDDLTHVWDVHPRTTPPHPPREWHAAVTSDNYPTTPDGEPLSEGDVDLEAGEVTAS